jgi:hypothetical protein
VPNELGKPTKTLRGLAHLSIPKNRLKEARMT